MLSVLRNLFRLHPWESCLAPLFKLMETALELLVPLLLARVADLGIRGQHPDLIRRITLELFLLALISILLSSCAQFWAAKASTNAARQLREDLMCTLIDLPFAESSSQGLDRWLTVLQSDTNTIQNALNLMLRLLLRSPFVVLGSCYVAVRIHPGLSLIFIPCALSLGLAFAFISYFSLPRFRRLQEKLENLTLYVQDQLAGTRIFRAFCLRNVRRSDFESRNRELNRQQMLASYLNLLLSPLSFILIHLAILALLWFASSRIEKGDLSSGQVLALYNYFAGILQEVLKFVSLLILMSKAWTSGRRAEHLLSAGHKVPRLSSEDSLKDSSSPVVPPLPRCGAAPAPARHAVPSVELNIENLCFTYAGGETPALQGISLRARSGQKIGIIGGTGSGKSTLLALAAGLYRPGSGKLELRVLGEDGRTEEAVFCGEALAELVSYVPQKAVLFRGSIRENLQLARAPSDDAGMWRALELALADEILLPETERRLPEKRAQALDHPVLRGGRNFSGGQRQRLALARGLLNRDPLLLLDDVSSALDFESEAALMHRLGEAFRDRLLITVSQRISALIYCDEILLLHEGKILARGSHEDLLENCARYRTIYQSQFPRDPRFAGRGRKEELREATSI